MGWEVSIAREACDSSDLAEICKSNEFWLRHLLPTLPMMNGINLRTRARLAWQSYNRSTSSDLAGYHPKPSFLPKVRFVPTNSSLIKFLFGP